MLNIDPNSNSQGWELEITCKNKKYLDAVVKAILYYGMIDFEVEGVECLSNLPDEPWDGRYLVLMRCSWFHNLKDIAEALAEIEQRFDFEEPTHEPSFNEELNISARAISNIDREYLSSGVITYISEDYEKNIPEHLDFWYNTSIICSPDNFSLGINLVYLKFEHPNYRTATFAFQLLVNQLEINIAPVSFEDSISAETGDTINIQIELLDPKTNASIENASVKYSWEYGLGTLNESSLGIYQTQVAGSSQCHDSCAAC